MKNNKNWEYSRLITNMKRWSFISKMSKANMASLELIPAKSHDPSVRRMMALPHEIETFTMLAVKEQEWQTKEITDREFNRAIDTIRSFQHPKLLAQKGKNFVKWLMMLTAATQFDSQMNPIYRINRYLTYFTYSDENIDMPAEIEKKFGLSYEKLIAPIVFLWLSFSDEDLKLSRSQFAWLIHHYKHSFDLITITRNEYRKELEEITTNEEDYIYCLRPSYSWPFVMDENIRYMPTPHLLIRSVTVSLMHRLTYGNDRLREMIGKFVLESYLYSLICKSNEFLEVLPEQEYVKGQKTLDVMTTVNDTIICFDSKSCTPQIGIRTFDLDAYDRTLQKIVKSYIQAYRHIRCKFGNEYKYLSVPVKQDRSNIYAVVVLADDPFFPLDEIHVAAANHLNIPIPSEEYDWLRGHVGIADVDAIEIQILERNNFLDAITANSRSKNYSDYWLVEGNITQDDTMTEYMEENVTDLVSTVIDEMKTYGL